MGQGGPNKPAEFPSEHSNNDGGIFLDEPTHISAARTPSNDSRSLVVDKLSYEIEEQEMTLLQQLMTGEFECRSGPSVPRKLLDNVSLSVSSGQILAVLGSSGSGKTTLLDVIACRNSGGTITGNVMINNIPRTAEMIKRCSAYVRQADRLVPVLTVKQTLNFVARLTLPKNWSSRRIEAKVDDVIGELGLIHIVHSQIGGGHGVRGISGGERRRVTIAAQMLLNPDILFLDEPTSGLDTYNAHNLVETLSKVAKNNRIILMTIHQPRSAIYQLFDLMMILSQGRIVYFGKAQMIVPYFTELGWPCPQLTNPCDFYVDLSTVNRKTQEAQGETQGRLQALVEAYEASNKDALLEPRMLEACESIGSDEGRPDNSYICAKVTTASQRFENLVIRKKNKPGPSRQFWQLLKRGFRRKSEDHAGFGVQALEALCMSVTMGFVFINLPDDQLSVRDRFGLLFMLAALYPYQIILDVIGFQHRQRSYEYYEMQDGLYGPVPLYFAKLIVDIPEHIILVVLYLAPAYSLSGLRREVSIIAMAFYLMTTILFCSRSLSFFAAFLMPNYQISVLMAQTIYTLNLLSSGFVYNLKSLFAGMKWASYTSYLKWGYQALAINELVGLNFTCDLPFQESCIQDGDEALHVWAMDEYTVYNCIQQLVTQILVFLSAAFIAIVFVPQKPYEH